MSPPIARSRRTPTTTAGKTRRSFGGAIRKLPSKRFQASYIHGAELTRYTAPTTFSAIIDAEGWLATERRLIESGAWTHRPRALRPTPRRASPSRHTPTAGMTRRSTGTSRGRARSIAGTWTT